MAVWITSLLAFSALVYTTEAFRCQHERDLEPGTNETNFAIRPQRSLDNKLLWITNMNIFLFGSITDPQNAKFEAGFYKDASDELVYKVIIDCGNSAWKTMYQPKKGNPKRWRSGTIDGGCPTGEFDLIATIGCLDHEINLNNPDNDGEPLPCARMAYFIFNGQVLEHDLLQVTRRQAGGTWYGPMYAEALPVYIRTANTFKARVMREGVTFNQEAYGKCVEFPSPLHGNCTAAREYVMSRSDYFYTDVSVPSMAPMSLQYAPRCDYDGNSLNFNTEQLYVVPDGSSISGGHGYHTCCCSYTDGFLADCQNNAVPNVINCAYRGDAYEEFKNRCAKYNSPLRIYNAATGLYEEHPIEA